MNVSSNFSNIQNLLKQAKSIHVAMLNKASKVRDEIIQRTQKGIDANNSAFTPYSRPYAVARQERGGRSTPVNLTSPPNRKGDNRSPGSMLRNISIMQIRGGARLYFPNAFERTKASVHHYGLGGTPKREFFALSNAQRISIKEYMSKYLTRGK